MASWDTRNLAKPRQAVKLPDITGSLCYPIPMTMTGLLFIIFGVLIILHPEILAYAFGGFLVLIGLGFVAAAWQFRRLKKAARSNMMSWFLRF